MNGTQNFQNPPNSCPHCGCDIPVNSPHSMCPSCLLKAGIQQPQTIDLESGTSSDTTSEINLDEDSSVGTGLPPVLTYVGDYELLEEVARGGMGVVYRAKQLSLNRIVAIKMILSGALADEKDIQRFHREAEAAAKLDHPGIVPIYEVGEHDNQSYYSMKYIQGPNLAEVTANKQLNIQDATVLLNKVVMAVEYAHNNGVIHRDLKPANILIDANQEPQVTDFGLAKQGSTQNALTLTGQILGTPSYMPPEQALGKSGELDVRSDIYSLGAILYELLTGRPPFNEESSLNTLNQVIRKIPLAPHRVNPTVPIDISSICMKCLEKQKFDRYPSAAALFGDLQNFLQGRATQARPLTHIESAHRYIQRHKFGFSIALTVLGLLVAVTLFSVWTYGAIAKNQDAKLCNLWLATKDPGLIGEIIPVKDDRVIVPKFEIPNREPIVLPHGEYRLRLFALNRLSETIQFKVDSAAKKRFSERAEFFHTVGLDDRSAFPEKAKTPSLITEANANQLIIPSSETHRAATPFLESKTSLPDLNRDGVGDAVFLNDDQLFAMDGKSVQKSWTRKIKPNKVFACVSIEHKVSEQPNVVAYASEAIGSDNDQLTAISATDGTVLWSLELNSIFKKIPPRPSVTIGGSEHRVKLAPAGAPDDPLIVCKFGRYFFVVEALTGRARWNPIDFKLMPTQSHFRYNDLGWVDQAAIVLPGSFPSESDIRPNSRVQTLFGFDVSNGNCTFDRDVSNEVLPLKVFNMGAGKNDVVVFRQLMLSETTFGFVDHLFVEDLNSGNPNWSTPLPACRSKFEIVSGPDINRDGFNEIYLFSMHQDEETKREPRAKVKFSYVDVLSGKDGTLLSTKIHRLDEPTLFSKFKFAGFFGIGPDSFPMIAVTYGASVMNRPWNARANWRTHFIKASDGELLHSLTTRGPTPPQLYDLNEDGLHDLFILTLNEQGAVNGHQIIRGTTAEINRGFFIPLALWMATAVPEGKQSIIIDDVTYSYESIEKEYEQILEEHQLDGLFAFPYSTFNFAYKQSPNGAAVKLDGNEDSEFETFVWENESLKARSEKTSIVRWNWMAPNGTGKVFGWTKDDEDNRILLVSSGNQLFGIDYFSGKPIWVCDGYFDDVHKSLSNPIPAHDIPSPPDRHNLFLKTSSQSKLPRFAFVLFDRNSGREVTIVKTALRLDSSDHSTKSARNLATSTNFSTTGKRPLPWVAFSSRFSRLSTFYSLVLVGLGMACYLMLFFRKLASTNSVNRDNETAPNKPYTGHFETTVIPLFFVPLACSTLIISPEINGWVTVVLTLIIATCIVLAHPKHRRTLFTWMLPLNVVVTTLVIAVAWVQLDFRNLHYAVRYEWAGWSLVIVPGLIVAVIWHYLTKLGLNGFRKDSGQKARGEVSR